MSQLVIFFNPLGTCNPSILTPLHCPFSLSLLFLSFITWYIMVQIIITPYIHLQYFDIFFSQKTWLNPVLLLFCRWKCSEQIMGMLTSLTFNAYSLTSNGPFLATLQHFLMDNHFTSYLLQTHGPSPSIFMFSWWPTFSFTNKTEEIINEFHYFSPYIYPPTHICFLLSSLLWQLKCLKS